MAKFDTGFSKNPGRLERMINKDGSFNVKRMNARFSISDLFQFFIGLKWSSFILLTLSLYLSLNFIFALCYWLFDCKVSGTNPDIPSFLNYFFFSVQTFTTLGYGTLSPKGLTANIIASIESFTGLLSFAMATGLLYGKFSKPKARIRFSNKAIIRPFKNGKALMFRLANERPNVLVNMTTRVIASFYNPQSGKRGFQELPLETNNILYFPLSWTVVHEIKEDSPLFNLSFEDLKKDNLELLITVTGYDDTYSSEIRTQFSYTADEIIAANTFIPAFHYNSDGQIIMDIDKIDDFE